MGGLVFPGLMPDELKDFLFEKFPISKPQLASQWVQSLSRKGFIPTPNSCLCSEHFEADCFRDYNGRQFLREDAVPTIFAASRSPGTETLKIELRRNRGIITKDGNKIPVNQFSTLPEREKLSARERPKLRASEKQGSAASLKPGGDISAPHPCSVGEHLQMTLDCHKTSICWQTGLRQLRELCESDALLLQLRTGLMGMVEGDTVCLHHEKVFVERYEYMQRTCCNPFNYHKKAIRKGLRSIDLDEAMFLTDRFALQFVPGWKLCTRCTKLLNGYADMDVDLRRRRKRDREGRTAKALKSLEFANPGRQTDFASESNRRDKRRAAKLSNDRQTISGKSKVYDSRGLLIASGQDICDCLDVDCMGCFYPCPDCGSRKCGVECRCDRKWLYEQVEVEGGEIIRNKYAG